MFYFNTSCLPLVFINPKQLTTNDGDNHNDNDNNVVSLPAKSNCYTTGEETQPILPDIGQSTINYDIANPHPPTPVEHCDTEKEKEDHVMPSSNRCWTNNALELLMGQYHDSDSELEPGEIP